MQSGALRPLGRDRRRELAVHSKLAALSPSASVSGRIQCVAALSDASARVLQDAQTAESAIRNLNNYDFHGWVAAVPLCLCACVLQSDGTLTGGSACRRSLRIDYADKLGDSGDKKPGGGDEGGGRGRGGGGGQRGTTNSIEMVNGVRLAPRLCSSLLLAVRLCSSLLLHALLAHAPARPLPCLTDDMHTGP